MDQRAKIPVSFPTTGPAPPTKSYWQDPPDEQVADYSSMRDQKSGDKLLPSEADTVIIGSGITGASVAWGLLSASARNSKVGSEEAKGDSEDEVTEAKKQWKVVMLEARQTCSGATGRNGGHTKAASYRSFQHHVSTVGLEEAKKIATLELNNIQKVHQFIRDERMNCEAWEGETVDVIYDQHEWESSLDGVKSMSEAFGNQKEGEYKIYESEEAKRVFKVSDTTWEGNAETVKGAVRYYAGSLSSYKFAVGLVKKCLERGMGLWTGTKVTALEKGDDGLWSVKAEGGQEIKAKRVVLATNGYTAALLPSKFQGVIVPLRGQVTAQRPGSKMPKEGLDTTYSFIYDGGYEYMVTRQKGVGARYEGDVIMGGGLVRGEKSEGGMMEFGITDDSRLNEGVSEYLRDTAVRYFGGENWGEDDGGGRVRQEWTGIMGFSPDGFPLVGEVPGEKGLWVSASFQGHGMVLCWMCAKALVAMMDGEGDDDPNDSRLDAWFPDSFRISEERLKKRFQGRFS
ncbi:FAD dependent oxidoreductase [Cladorrhinum sp. PSN259]|nr:FAD dependent oxidoreductase [Cladorrhinum sp. PSN259]